MALAMTYIAEITATAKNIFDVDLTQIALDCLSQ